MPCCAGSSTASSIKVRSRFSSIRRPIQSATLSSACYAHKVLPCGLAASDAFARFESTMSVTTLIETRNCATAAPVRVTFLNKINNLPTKVLRNWLAPQ